MIETYRLSLDTIDWEYTEGCGLLSQDECDLLGAAIEDHPDIDDEDQLLLERWCTFLKNCGGFTIL